MIVFETLRKVGISICNSVISAAYKVRDSIDNGTGRTIITDPKKISAIPSTVREILITGIAVPDTKVDLSGFADLKTFETDSVTVKSVPKGIERMIVTTAPECDISGTDLTRVHIDDGQFPKMPITVTKLSCCVAESKASFKYKHDAERIDTIVYADKTIHNSTPWYYKVLEVAIVVTAVVILPASLFGIAALLSKYLEKRFPNMNGIITDIPDYGWIYY